MVWISSESEHYLKKKCDSISTAFFIMETKIISFVHGLFFELCQNYSYLPNNIDSMLQKMNWATS